MKINVIALGAAALLSGCAASESMEMSADEQSKLASELRGYEVSGPPVSCVSLRTLGGNRSVGEGAIIFGSGRTLYVNRPAAGCPSLEFGRALRIRTPATQLCSNEIVTVFDPATGMDHGGCGLGEFTPYRRVD